MNVQHSSKSNEHYTPTEISERARRVMGGIDLDPASCPLANTRVQASKIFTKEDDGLFRPWHGRVFLNPPGGKMYGESYAKLWWFRLIEEYKARRVTEAIFLAFSVEALQTTQVDTDGVEPMLAFPVCVPSRRPKYWNPEGVGEQPTHAGAIAYLGDKPLEFYEAFRDLGAVVCPFSMGYL